MDQKPFGPLNPIGSLDQQALRPPGPLDLQDPTGPLEPLWRPLLGYQICNVFAARRRHLCGTVTASGAEAVSLCHRGMALALRRDRWSQQRSCRKDIKHRMKQVQMAQLGPIFAHNRFHGLWEASGMPPDLHTQHIIKSWFSGLGRSVETGPLQDGP